ncbi:hypothetical protein MSG28_002156 [Choristoneura fumiferana]|uniref:Uncharacterized protein n=1 Tax=Choristoneura fumiferana TaxID=7141 RepID=A0ACC0JUK2_CHOFU|nr:hypothetical protein MSG28_002156 [Choristoneura fumiferana]
MLNGFKMFRRSFSQYRCLRSQSKNPFKRTWGILAEEFPIMLGLNKKPQHYPEHADVVIIGGGFIGSSVAYWLKTKASHGLSVVVIEKDLTYAAVQKNITLGSLTQHFSLPENIYLSQHSAEFLRNSKEYLGPNVDLKYTPSGHLLLACEEHAEKLEQNVGIQREFGIRNELLSPKEIKSKFPWINTEDIKLGCVGYESEGSFDSWALLRGLVQKSIDMGTTYIQADVTGFELEQQRDVLMEGVKPGSFQRINKVLYRTPDNEEYAIKFAACILAAGHESSQVAQLAKIGNGEGLLTIPLPIEKRECNVYSIENSAKSTGLNTPLMMDTSGVWLKKGGLGSDLLCGAIPVLSPSATGLTAEDHVEQIIKPSLVNRIPQFQKAKVTSIASETNDYCHYDDSGILGPHSYHNNLYIAAGFGKQDSSSLMTKFSKKLVSKCIYIQILKCTETELLGLFMGSGGWRLVHMWLTESIVAKNWPLVRELLELLLLCPVDIEHLKTNNCPKLVKELSKDGNQFAIRALASKLVEQWLKTVKGEHVVPVQSTDIPQIIIDAQKEITSESSVKHEVPDFENVDQSFNEHDTKSDLIQPEISSDHLIQKEDCNGIEDEPKEELDKEPDTLPVLKITLKDGKQILSQVDETDNKVSDKSKDKHKSKSKEKSHDNSSSKSSSSKHSSKSLSSNDKHKSSKSDSSHRHSSKESSRDKSKHSSHSSKSKSDSSRRSSSDKSSSSSNKSKEDRSNKSSSDKSRSKDKIKDEKKKETSETSAEKSGPPSIHKLGKIPKLSDVKKEKPSISIEVRKPDEPKPKTVKTFNSKFRKHGLEEEVKPPPSRASLLNKKPLPTLPPTVSIPKRPSPVHNEPPPEKKPKVEPVEKPGAIKLIPPKPKRCQSCQSKISSSVYNYLSNYINSAMLLLESDMFMDALNASATNKKEPKKRKRRTSGSKDGNTTNDGSPPHTPNSISSPTSESKSVPPKFYQDTLDTEEEKEKTNDRLSDSNENKENSSDKELDESIDMSEPPPHTLTINGLKGVLCYHKRKGPKKSIKWKPDSELEEIQYFDLDETERVNDTLDTEEEKEKTNDRLSDSNENKENSSDKELDESIDMSEPPPHTLTINGLKGVLCYHKRKGPKKSIKWKPDSELEEIQYFDLDETERVNVTKTFTDMKHLERIHEREAFQKGRNLSGDDLMEERTSWKPLIPIDTEGQVQVEYGKNSKEKDIQAIRQKGTLQPLYFHKSMIPDSALEPDTETHTYSEPTIIPLEDVTGNQDNTSDFRNMPWPEPKGNTPPASSNNINMPAMFPTNMPQFPNGFPPAQFPNVPGFQGPPGMVPADWQNGVPPHIMANGIPGGIPPAGLTPGAIPPVNMPPGMMVPPDNMMMGPEIRYLLTIVSRNMQRWFFAEDRSRPKSRVPKKMSFKAPEPEPELTYQDWTFTVSVPDVNARETVVIVGSIYELGEWDYTKAVPLENHPGTDLWSKTLTIPNTCEIYYRYAICAISDENKDDIVVRYWETNIKPRVIPETMLHPVTDIFGKYNDRVGVTRGWLTSQTLLQFKFVKNPLKLKTRLTGRVMSIKVTPVSLCFGAEGQIEDSVSTDTTEVEAPAGVSVEASTLDDNASLSKDMIPVIYHDFYVCISMKRKKEIDFTEMLELPVKDLTLEHLQKLKVYHLVEGRNHETLFNDEDLEEHQPFPTLEMAFKEIDIHVGFNVELKWTMELEDGTFELNNPFDMNTYVDKVLEVVLKNGGDRRIIFSCFNPDICTMVRYKQNKYPVMFLTVGKTEKYQPYRDPRCLSIPAAVQNAISSDILGIVVHTEDLLRDPSQVNFLCS